MTDIKITRPTLATCSLVQTEKRRDLPPNFTLLPGEKLRYDDTTLWYDAIWHRSLSGGVVELICPRLHGLRPLIETGALRLDGLAVHKQSIVTRERHDIIRIPARRKPARITLDVEGQEVGSDVSDRHDGAFFKGLNTAMVLSRDNDLRWIEDFIRYHVRLHNLEALLFFDNGSTQYGLDEIAAACARGGLKRLMLISVPLPYRARGKQANGNYSFEGGFLQLALLNIARIRFLRQARAVLQCDIDELVWTDDGTSIFDRAARHPLGLVRFNGEWRYPGPGNAGDLITHADHLFQNAVSDTCPAKYCIRPGGLLQWASWSVHRLNKLRQKTSTTGTKAGFWHCRHVTTAWKNENRLKARDSLTLDPTLQAALERAGLNAS